MRRISIYILSSLMPFIGGCDGFVACCTKDVSGAMFEHASRGQIESMIGAPKSEELFHAPYPTTTEVRNGYVGVATSKAYYGYHGRADDLVQFQGLGMLVGLTFGLGEVIAFPESIKLSEQLDKSFHQYYVWYDDKGKCIAFTSSNDLGRGK